MLRQRSAMFGRDLVTWYEDYGPGRWRPQVRGAPGLTGGKRRTRRLLRETRSTPIRELEDRMKTRQAESPPLLTLWGPPCPHCNGPTHRIDGEMRCTRSCLGEQKADKEAADEEVAA